MILGEYSEYKSVQEKEPGRKPQETAKFTRFESVESIVPEVSTR